MAEGKSRKSSITTQPAKPLLISLQQVAIYGILLLHNWCEVVRKKVESTTWEQAVDDVRPFIASADELGLSVVHENVVTTSVVQVKSD